MQPNPVRGRAVVRTASLWDGAPRKQHHRFQFLTRGQRGPGLITDGSLVALSMRTPSCRQRIVLYERQMRAVLLFGQRPLDHGSPSMQGLGSACGASGGLFIHQLIALPEARRAVQSVNRAHARRTRPKGGSVLVGEVDHCRVNRRRPPHKSESRVQR